MDETLTIWGVHHTGGLDFVERDFVAIGWPDAGDLTDVAVEREDFKARLRERYPDRSEAWVANAAGQLLRFRHVMRRGDLVVYPRKLDRTINVGRIAGDYVYDPASQRYPNVRAVEWLRTDLPRDAFTQGCLYEFGSALSVFTITTHAHEVLRVLAAGDAHDPAAAPLPEGSAPFAPPGEDEPSVERIAELTQDFVLKTFQTELKGHGFAQFCGWLLEALGYTTQVSPPGADQGIDIIASEDALGVKQPLLKVQCKSGKDPVGSPDVQALNGTLSATDLGVFFAVGGFTVPAKQVASGMPRMRLIGPAELVELVLDHYAALPDEAKQQLPLRRVWMPERPSAEA
jgi:restriction system protein